MTVEELIKALEWLPYDLTVFYDDYTTIDAAQEDTDPYGARIVRIS